MSFADLSLKASGADGYYHPPNWDPKKGSRDKNAGSKGANQYQMFGLIRFETPWNMYCKTCNSHIGRGVRYNAKKDNVGKYFSTKIWQFSMRCHECSGSIVIQTDPKNTDYKCVEGVRRAAASLAPSKEISHPHFGKSIMPVRNKKKMAGPIDEKLKLPVLAVGEMKDHKGGVFAMKTTNDGSYMISGGQDKINRLYNPHNQKLIKEYKGHGKTILDIAISPDKASFASAGEDKAIFIWDVKDGRADRRLYGHNAKINTLAYNKDASCLLSGSYDGSVKIWDMKSYNDRRPIQTLDDFTDSVTGIVVTSNTIHTSCVDGRLRSYDLRVGKLTTDMVGHPLTSLTLTEDQNCLLTSAMNGEVKLFDKASGQQLKTYDGHIHKDMMVQCGLTHHDNQVFSTSEDGAVYFWDLITAKKVHCLQASDHVVTRIQYHPKQVLMFTAEVTGKITVWR